MKILHTINSKDNFQGIILIDEGYYSVLFYEVNGKYVKNNHSLKFNINQMSYEDECIIKEYSSFDKIYLDIPELILL